MLLRIGTMLFTKIGLKICRFHVQGDIKSPVSVIFIFILVGGGLSYCCAGT